MPSSKTGSLYQWLVRIFDKIGKNANRFMRGAEFAEEPSATVSLPVGSADENVS
ncbi:hypothetical protein D3C87_2037730 [compost metagenome]